MNKSILTSLISIILISVSCTRNKLDEYPHFEDYINQTETNINSIIIASINSDSMTLGSYLKTVNFARDNQINELNKGIQLQKKNLIYTEYTKKNKKELVTAKTSIEDKISILKNKIDSIENSKIKLNKKFSRNNIFYIGTVFNYKTKFNKENIKQYIVIETIDGDLIYKGVKPSSEKVASYFLENFSKK